MPNPISIKFGWAIDTNSNEGHSFIGWGWKEDEHEYTETLTPRLFHTREQARGFLRKMKARKYWKFHDGKYVAFPKAKVIRVRITVQGLNG